MARLCVALLMVGACGVARGQEGAALPSTEEIKALVDGGKYREALKPLFRVLALKGEAARGYDRLELLMLRAECQMQIKDQRGALDTLDQARRECFLQNRAQLAAGPTALAMLVQKSNAWQYKSKSEAGMKPLPILDRTLRPAAYAALLRDELGGAQRRVQALAGVKTIAPVLEAAKLAGAVHSLDIVVNPKTTPDQLETAALTGQVTSNADRLLLAAIDDLSRTAGTIETTANQLVTEPVGRYDRATRKSWVETQTRRRGPSNQDVQTLGAIGTTCDKIRGTAIDLALALATDFKTYQSIMDKADAVKAKANAILHEDYGVVPP